MYLHIFGSKYIHNFFYRNFLKKFYLFIPNDFGGLEKISSELSPPTTSNSAYGTTGNVTSKYGQDMFADLRVRPSKFAAQYRRFDKPRTKTDGVLKHFDNISKCNWFIG